MFLFYVHFCAKWYAKWAKPSPKVMRENENPSHFPLCISRYSGRRQTPDTSYHMGNVSGYHHFPSTFSLRHDSEKQSNSEDVLRS